MTTRSVHAALIPPQRSSRHPSIFPQVRGLSAFSVSTFVFFNWISLNCSWIFPSPSTIKLCPKCYSYFLSLVLPWKILQEFIERPQYASGRKRRVIVLESQSLKLNVWDNFCVSVRPILHSESQCQNFLSVWHLVIFKSEKLKKNITKGTTDPRVEFISQVQSSQILIKLQFQNLDYALTSKSQPNITLSIKQTLQNLDQDSTS